MGPMLMTGLACFGTAIAVGLLATSTSRPAEATAGASPSRSLAIVLIAFAMGSAVMGVVVGLLAIETTGVPDPASGVYAAGPAIVGAIIGLGLIVRGAGDVDLPTACFAALFLLGLASLGATVALLAMFIPTGGAAAPSDWPFVVLGLASGASALGIGITGSRSLQAMKGSDEPTAKAISARQIRRCLPLQVVAIGATVIAILLIAID